MNNNMKLPANCAMMNDDEMMNVSGGSAIETAFKAVVAIGGAAALTGVAAVAAKGILSIFSGNPGQWIQDSVNGGKNFIEASLNAGQNFLNKLMGK